VGECSAGIIRVETKGIQVTGKSISRTGNPPKKARKKDENLLLSDLQQWEIIEHGAEGNGRRELHRVYKFKTFEAAFKFMSTAATRIVSAQDHHPRWENMYNQVEVWLSTFDMENQITDRDLKLARSLEQLWDELDEGI
jgi:4a-hydroxytetrahydrobiopterin dehydratase